MTSISRRTALADLSLGAVFGFPAILTHTRVHGADFTMKYANNAPAHPSTHGAHQGSHRRASAPRRAARSTSRFSRTISSGPTPTC